MSFHTGSPPRPDILGSQLMHSTRNTSPRRLISAEVWYKWAISSIMCAGMQDALYISPG